MKKKLVTTSLLVALSSGILFAKPVINPVDMHKKTAEMTKKKGVFSYNENFPKDYFLISKNLPFMAGLTLHHPRSSELNLSKEQIDKIVAIKKKTVPSVLKIAMKIRGLEQKLTKDVVFKNQNPKEADLLIDEIAKLKTSLSKKHIRCIQNVKAILSMQQFQKLVEYSSKPPFNSNK